VPLRKGATRAGLQVTLEIDSSLLVRKFYGEVKLPRAVTRSVGAAAGVVVGEAGGDVRRSTDVEVWFRIGILEDVDESLVLRHARPEATAMPNADVSKLTECVPWPCEDRSFCDSAIKKWWKDSRRWLAEPAFACQELAWLAEPKLVH
jgi:hypothetical protein